MSIGTSSNPQASKFALLTPKEMDSADHKAIASGISGVDLMEATGRAVAEAVMARWARCPVTVLCGPGNNGGDGFVAARYLTEAGWPVSLTLLGSRENLKGDAAYHAGAWSNETEPFSPDVLYGKSIVIDAIFGSGLSRPVDGVAGQMIESLKERKIPICAIDVPSGVDGATGLVRGIAAPADITVTFFRKKPGHLIYPGRALCGSVIVADIGIPASRGFFSRWVFALAGLDFVVVFRRSKSGSSSHADDGKHFFQTIVVAQMRAFDVKAFGLHAGKAKLDRPTLAIGF